MLENRMVMEYENNYKTDDLLYELKVNEELDRKRGL